MDQALGHPREKLAEAYGVNLGQGELRAQVKRANAHLMNDLSRLFESIPEVQEYGVCYALENVPELLAAAAQVHEGEVVNQNVLSQVAHVRILGGKHPQFSKALQEFRTQQTDNVLNNPDPRQA